MSGALESEGLEARFQRLFQRPASAADLQRLRRAEQLLELRLPRSRRHTATVLTRW